ncbi:MAG: aldo/keto reductase [Verrucomicrobia bacterium]|nr:aldo/keto reductase [Verrucomicrobiota bacterium]
MNTKPLGSSGLNASVIGLGAWVLGGGTVWGPNPDDSESIRTIQEALDLGVNLIDTAPAYGWGRSETVVGQALKGRRDKAIVATKCGLWWEDNRGSFFAHFDGRPMNRSLRPDTLQLEIEHSLRRLGTDRIDLYQTHWPAAPPEATPIADTMATLVKLRDQGKVRALGVCNVSPAELLENLRCGGIVSDQFRYSMLHRAPEKDILPPLRRERPRHPHLHVSRTRPAHRQGGHGPRLQPRRVPHKRRLEPLVPPVNRRRILDQLAAWKDLTDKYACTLAQLVLAWTAAQPGVTHVLAGARNPTQLRENVRAASLVLEPADLARMRRDVEALGEPAHPS